MSDKFNSTTHNCPKCGSDLRGPTHTGPHPEWYGFGDTCEVCGDPPHFSRVIGVYDRDRDRTVAWRCPDCGHQEART